MNWTEGAKDWTQHTQGKNKIYDQLPVCNSNYDIGAETWTVTKQLEQKLITAQRAIERRILLKHHNKRQNKKLRNQETNSSKRYHG